MSSLVQQSFYDTLDTHTADVARTAAQEIKDAARQSIQHTIDIGKRLVMVRDALNGRDGGDTSFSRWIEEEFAWSRSQAYNFINIYNRFGDRPNFGQLDIAVSAINLLASPSAPDEVVEELLEQAENGETIGYSKAKETLDKAKKRKAPESEGVVNPLPGMPPGLQPRKAADFAESAPLPPPLPSKPEPEPPATPAAPTLPPPLPSKPEPKPPATPAAPTLPPPLPSKPEPPATPAAPTLPPPLPSKPEPPATPASDEEKHAAMIYAQLRILEIATSQAYQQWHELPKQYKITLNGDLVMQNARNLMTSPALRSAAYFSALNAEVRAEQ